MKRYHGHTLLYLHETIDLGSADSAQFVSEFSDVYQPMMTELGARLFAMWETTPYNGHWPQVTVIWEIDAFAYYARIGRAQAAAAATRRLPASGRGICATSVHGAKTGSCTPDGATRRWLSCKRRISQRAW